MTDTDRRDRALRLAEKFPYLDLAELLNNADVIDRWLQIGGAAKAIREPRK